MRAPTFLAQALAVSVAMSCVASVCVAEPSKEAVDMAVYQVESKGYAPTEDGMRELLKKRDYSAIFGLILIEFKQYVSLLPEVRSWYTEVQSSTLPSVRQVEGYMLMETIFALDKNMKDKELIEFLTSIRHQIFEVGDGHPDFRGIPITPFNALVAAQEYYGDRYKRLGEDLFQDFKHLGMSETMGSLTEDAIRETFKLFGDRMTEQDASDIYTAKAGSDEMQAFVLRRAHEKSLLLNR